MSDKTKIEWSDATWNPVTGCSKVSEGCRNCYAMKFAERWRGTPGHYFENGFDITFRPNKQDQPLRWKRPRKIFVNSMSDLFHPDVPFDFIDKVFAVMALAPHHTFQILTKRPERMKEYFQREELDDTLGHEAMYLYEQFGGRGDCSLAAGLIHGPGKVSNHPSIPVHPKAWPLPNVWIGTSVENQKAADERIPLLIDTPAAVRFLSCEPLLEEVSLQGRDARDGSYRHYLQYIDWVIVGGESGPRARPVHPDWIRQLRFECQAARVPFFFKQWGEWAPVHELRCNDPGIKGRKWFNFDPDTALCRIGKQAAGRMLDGRTWDEFPS